MDYHQPASAPFSPDSIELADRLAGLLLSDIISQALGQTKSGHRVIRIMDLCCGCGVVGLETERRLRHKFLLCRDRKQLPLASESVGRSWLFLDIQEEYRSYFELNRDRLLGEVGKDLLRHDSSQLCAPDLSGWKTMNYRDIESREDLRESFDWIISNPPYFDSKQGCLPPDTVKARSRFFLDGSFEELLLSIRVALSPQGRAMLLVRNLNEHQIDRRTEISKIFLPQKYQCDWLEPVRGTGLLFIVSKN